ncbi:hypothetical protein SAMN02745181_3775 [Rubritalea squalenifaciens DSM 18772]|uniref:Uncharacterized protein n=1 Tax=Rubritalea squalenifaciens DSM 18772 TaxID=1123071 RepID=A0A1M6SBT3_9BACT|nr:hypothetical protein [Rubritalea squalenifaciens]SHK41968.1 hypothetical protein SAMN02745181_3775 [Rubritalea squalenifaciens DSM 18772]
MSLSTTNRQRLSDLGLAMACTLGILISREDYTWNDHRIYLRIAILITVCYVTVRLISLLGHKLLGR